jgi:hypothetical protein
MSITEVLSLPDSDKLALAQALLEEFGARVVRQPNARGEIIHSCFAGETRVMTDKGVVQIKDLVGKSPVLMTTFGQWVKAPVRSFGVQPLVKVVVRRRRLVREIFTTPGHRWRVRSYPLADGKVTVVNTQHLKSGDSLDYTFRKKPVRSKLSPFGVVHGFAFGDGTRAAGNAGAGWAAIYGEKDKVILDYVPRGAEVVASRTRDCLELRGLPRSYKNLPKMDEGPQYLYSWLAGYFVADGCVTEDGSASISSACREHLEFVKLLGDHIGIGSFSIMEQQRKGCYGRGVLHDWQMDKYGECRMEKETALYQLTFLRETVPSADFFLVPEHRKRWEANPVVPWQSHKSWIVVLVEPTDRVEEVFCAVVEGKEAFALEDNLLTGNCCLPFGLHAHGDAHPSASINYKKLVINCPVCGSGGLMWFVSMCRGTTSVQTRDWLTQKAMVSIDDVNALLAYLDSVYNPVRENPEPIPRYSPRVLDPWRFFHPYMTEVRHVPMSSMSRFDIGYGMVQVTPTIRSERIIIPHYWRGELVGWQSRRLASDGTAKYLNTEGFPKDETIFNYDPNVPVMVVEGVMSVLVHPDDPHTEATFSASVTDRQLRLLADHPEVILFFDSDTAGFKATRKVGEALLPYTKVMVVQNSYDADPADLADDDYRDLPRVPWSVWEPPTKLLPYRRPHPAPVV